MWPIYNKTATGGVLYDNVDNMFIDVRTTILGSVVSHSIGVKASCLILLELMRRDLRNVMNIINILITVLHF